MLVIGPVQGGLVRKILPELDHFCLVLRHLKSLQKLNDRSQLRRGAPGRRKVTNFIGTPLYEKTSIMTRATTEHYRKVITYFRSDPICPLG